MIRTLRWRTLAKKTTLKGLAAPPGKFHLTLNSETATQSFAKNQFVGWSDFMKSSLVTTSQLAKELYGY